MRVLVVEDHRELAETIATGLRREGMAVDVSFDGQSALTQTGIYEYDVIVLDRDLPRLHGDQVCEAARAGRWARARADADRGRRDRRSRRGLGLGADDYLPKPFAFAELVARIRALGRRAQPALPPVLERGDVRLDSAPAAALGAAARLLDLSAKELAVLELLMSLAGGGAVRGGAAVAGLGRGGRSRSRTSSR